MKNRFLTGMAIGLCFMGISYPAQAQTEDSAFIIKPQPAVIVTWKKYKPAKQLPRAVLKLNAGYGWRTASISDQLSADMKEYYKKLMSGFVWDASFDFFINDKFGIRVAFYQYRASHSDQVYNTDTGKTGMLDTKDRITYIGPAFVFRLPFGHNAWIFDANAGMGYIGFREKDTFANEYFKADGASIGLQTGAGIEYKIAPQVGIGINMLITSGAITRFHHDTNGVKSTVTVDSDEAEGCGQISFGIGIRYYIKTP